MIYFTEKLSLVACSLALLPLSICAQGSLPAEQRINGKMVWEAFEPQRQILQQSSAVIYTDEKSRIKSLYGTLVSGTGHILTKASEIEGEDRISVRIGAELYTEVDRLGVDEGWDIALLKVNADEKFTPVVISEEDDVQQGYWVISNGSSSRGQRRVRVGIVSATTREILTESSKVVLGVLLGAGQEDGLKIKQLSTGGGAGKAGLKEGDVLLSVGGMELKERADLLKALVTKKPGELVTVEVMRGEQKLSFKVELSARPDDQKMVSRNDQMSGGGKADQLSERRSGFPRVIHHDTPLTRVSVGGPLLNLDGICVGMNIARADRVTTLAIPARELREIIEQMIR